MSPDKSGVWLTKKRLQAHGLLLAVALWSVFLWTLATPALRDRNNNLKGTDFLHLYTLGSLAMAHRGADLYSMDAQAVLATHRVSEANGIWYLPLYPPQVSLLFAPFARLSYGWALALWWASCTSIYGFCCYLVWRVCPNLRDAAGTVTTLAVAFPAFFNLIAWGQTSAIALVCFTLMYFLLRDRREFMAGLALGCLIFKPQLGLAAAVVFVGIGAWRVVTGAVISAVVQLCVGMVYYGMGPTRQWVAKLSNVGSVLPLLEPKPYQTHCLRTFWVMVLPWTSVSLVLYAVSAITTLALTIAVWRKAAPLGVRFSALMLATVLVAPHLTVYDLVILAPMLLLMTDWLQSPLPARATRWMGPLLYLVYALPLLGPLARWTHIQLSVVAMSVLLFLISRICIAGGSAFSANDGEIQTA
jgi:hypothetical protein